MNRIYKLLISRETMGVLFMILAMVLAVATFIENDFGVQTSWALVYHAWWFELIFILLAINMLGNMFHFKMWKKRRFPVFLFHFAFFLIIAGAATTRYTGIEGDLSIREGETANTFYTSDQYISLEVDHQPLLHQQVFLSPTTPHEFSKKITLNGQKIRITSEAFIPHAALQPMHSRQGKPILGLLLPGTGQRKESFLSPGEVIVSDGHRIGFESSDTTTLDFLIKRTPHNGLSIRSSQALKITSMKDHLQKTLPAGEWASLSPGWLFKTEAFRIAMSRFWPTAEFKPVSLNPSHQKGQRTNAVAFHIQGDGIDETRYVLGQKGKEGTPVTLQMGQTALSIRYGSLPLKLPFALRLNDFQLERYPGSQSPSSYASEVTLLDPQHNKSVDYRIFMNNILSYQGYRFYQSSYDPDEKGTVLSVNHDFWGSAITYLGYLLLAVGMFWALFAPETRFRQLLNKTNEIYKQRKSLLLFALLFVPLSGQAQSLPPQPNARVAKALGHLWVQDNGGRIKPLNTVHQEVMIKLVKHNAFKGFNPDQMLLGLLTHPAAWQKMPLITIKSPQLKKTLGIQGPKAAYTDFFDSQQAYKLRQQVEEAYHKKPSERNKLESEVIKVDEQVNVFYLAQSGSLYKIFPTKEERHRPWMVPSESPVGLSTHDSLFITSALPTMILATREGKITKALQIIQDIKDYQIQQAADLLPTQAKLNAELLYNRLNIFLWLATLFFSLGILLVLYNIAGLIFPSILKRWILRSATWILIAGFLFHSFGLALRWYISGHAPWSNGYESMLFIGWALLLAGLIFSRRSPLVVSVAALFAGVVLMVSHLSWMNPQITPLVPVLKSYWLTLHVAIIIGGYGFLTLGALLGFLNLLLTALQSSANKIRIRLTIDELTAINEMSLTVGLYLMTIGSFLGGVWANESWGRYWGWDPKETWSLITVLIYAFVMHIRFIPGLRGKLAFNTASLISFSSVIMTYLGVNYYLSGLHSYAAGDPVPIPGAIYYALVCVTLLIGLAYWREQKMKTQME